MTDTSNAKTDAAKTDASEPSNTKPKNIIGLVIWLVICFGASGIGALFTTSKIPGWYGTLAKPEWTPPSWLFGPVWTLLYAMMAIAAWLVWKRGGFAGAKVALTWFLIQLALNSMWSWLFFGLERPDWAAIEIVILWFAIAITIVCFRKHSAMAATLLVPYILWVTFATALNIAIWRLNS